MFTQITCKITFQIVIESVKAWKVTTPNNFVQIPAYGNRYMSLLCFCDKLVLIFPKAEYQCCNLFFFLNCIYFIRNIKGVERDRVLLCVFKIHTITPASLLKNKFCQTLVTIPHVNYYNVRITFIILTYQVIGKKRLS